MPSDAIKREHGESWVHRQMGVKAEEVTLRRGDDEQRRMYVYRKTKDTYIPLGDDEQRTHERWVKIADLPERQATEVLFALAEAHGYELEGK